MRRLLHSLLALSLTEEDVLVGAGHHRVNPPADIRPDLPGAAPDLVCPPHLDVLQQVLALLHTPTPGVGVQQSCGTEPAGDRRS